MRVEGVLRSPRIYSVITDFMPHRVWLSEEVDGYFVASEESRKAMLKRGVPDSRVFVTGIPIQIAESSMSQEMRGDTILVIASGLPPQFVKAVASSVLSQTSLSVFLIAGRNRKLGRLETRFTTSPTNKRLFQYDFVPQEVLHGLASRCCLAVSKAGGLITSELLALSKPMVIVRPVPGQEELNASYLVDSGVAIRADTVSETLNAIGELTSRRSKLLEMRSACQRIATPKAAEKIASIIRNSLNEMHTQ